MPVTVVVGGQFGSEGKGKTAAHLARTEKTAAIIRVGGTNSGHTAIDKTGRRWVFRQLPAALVDTDAVAVLPAGSLIDVDILLSEIDRFPIDIEKIWIDPRASVITEEHKATEAALIDAIGSTSSGTGASLVQRLQRDHNHVRAGDHPALFRFIRPDLANTLREMLNYSERILIEGTQGFGLSVWHSDYYPFTTSRDTTAASFVAEAGLGPQDVDKTVLVLRTFPIRVGGNSGPLTSEIDWPTLAQEAALPLNFRELTTATRRTRRVARFDGDIVRRAIAINAPNVIVLNHMDYVDPSWMTHGPTIKSVEFLKYVETQIGMRVSLLGYGPDTLIDRNQIIQSRAA
jgi:adenylosuccinate synthase